MKSKFTELSIDEQNQSTTVQFFKSPKKGTVICRLYDRWYGIFHEGRTTCKNGDVFDEKLGRAIAYNRARRKELKHNLFMINKEREYIKAQYEQYMKALDKRESINLIYLNGVEDELREAGLNIPKRYVEVDKPVNPAEPAPVAETSEETNN